MSDNESMDSVSDYESDGSDDFVASPKASKTMARAKPLSDSTNNTSDSSSSAIPQSNGKLKASEQYQKLSQLEHILKRPDTYIGSVESTGVEMWCFDAATETMVFKEVQIVPGLYKIFDEILVNAADNKIRDSSMRNLRVKIDPENNTILVMNDGKGIPIEIHDKEKMYIPELIFGNLLTSSNYDDDQKKVTGGRNGYGAKLCNIFSTEFQVETADANTGLLYKQTWTNNMSKVSKPKITQLKKQKEYTKVSFKPDLAKFGMDSLDEEILSVLRRRVYDLCGTVRDCNVYLNDKKLNIRNFKGYVEMYVKAIKERSPEPIPGENGEVKNFTTVVHEVFNDRWELGFAVSDGTFNQVSFVNSIATTSGGTHVKWVSDQIITKLVDTLSKKEKGKKKLMIKPQEVRNNMFLFLNCLIENPAFTSQTKEQLTTKVTQFGGKPSEKLVISDDFIKKILRTSIVDKIRAIANANEDKALQKADGSKKQRIKGQVKLEDANKAGTAQGNKCTLILTEGDSALSLAVSGLAVVGRDYYGCFPLRGKLLNVREATADQISKNVEINALKQIIGLQHKKVYTPENIKTLRYGHIMIMTDQDHDGSHIKGLIINFLESSFPGLLNIPGFLLEFITPIVKVTIKKRGGGKQVLSFYSMPEYEKWREEEGLSCRWTQKYYKGLGTSGPAEAREYFAALDRHRKTFHALQGDDKEMIDLAFSKKKADDRKDWLQGLQPGTHLDPELTTIPISEFINKELILFSMADNIRSIPSVLDGLKPGQRKVLYACFKRNLRSEIKVSRLIGYVSEHTEYHHGEQSLAQTIIGLAQNFIGSNNLNILKPIGAFGTRAAGGKDFSAPRYIFTALSEVTRTIFNPLDNPLYTYVQEDEQTVEPQWYLPVIPMLLVNGTEGIGTGWSTNIPSFNPLDIVENIRNLMVGEPLKPMIPWYKGFEGLIEPNGPDRYRVLGKIEQVDETTIEITEIPAKTWTNNVKEFLLAGLDNLKGGPWIKDMEEQHGINIRFIIKLSSEEMAKTLKIGLLERFKLISSISMTNMVAFDPLGRIKRYDNVGDILRDFYYVRLEFYQKRKDYISEDLQNQLTRLSEQARFIKSIIDKEISVSNKKRIELVELLQKHNFVKFNKNGVPVRENVDTSLFVEAEADLEEVEEEIGDISQINAGGVGQVLEGANEHVPVNVFSFYDYLLGMSIWSLTRERYEKILKQKDEKEHELNVLLGKSAKDLWNEDLENFMIGWEKFLIEDARENETMIPTKSSKHKGTKSKPKPKPKRVNEDDNDLGESPKKRAKPTPKAKPVKSEPNSKSASPKGSKTKPKLESLNEPKVTEIKVEKQPDVLSFFSAPKNTKKIKNSRIESMFSSDDDDDILGLSNNSTPQTKESKNSTLVTYKKPKARIQDDIADLDLDIVSPKPKGDRTKRKIKYALIDSDNDMSPQEESESDASYED